MWLFREVSSPYLFVLAQIDPDIKWRSHSFRLKFGGTAELKKQVCIYKWNYGWTLMYITATKSYLKYCATYLYF